MSSAKASVVVLKSSVKCSGAWTDRFGVVHENDPQDGTRTRCGKSVEGVSCRTARRGCDTCVRLNLKEWALGHRCAPECGGGVASSALAATAVGAVVL